MFYSSTNRKLALSTRLLENEMKGMNEIRRLTAEGPFTSAVIF